MVGERTKDLCKEDNYHRITLCFRRFKKESGMFHLYFIIRPCSSREKKKKGTQSGHGILHVDNVSLYPESLLQLQWNLSGCIQ